MISAGSVPAVEADEGLARFIVYSKHVRSNDATLKPDAFMPHPHQDLSVTRHLLATELELWTVGEEVAAAQGRTLYGRGDIFARHCLGHRLAVNADPVDGNPNHANITGWPADKAAQKVIALEIAAKSVFVPRPGAAGQSV